jgi:hypothetical protein
MTTRDVTTHVVDGHAYVIDEHRMIREPGTFNGLPAYAPYFWNAYLDGSYDEERWEDGEHVIIFTITEGDRYDYPELAGATRVFIGEDPRGCLHTRLDRRA